MLEINKTHAGDCLKIMQQIDNNSIDLILCDPPYGTTKCKWDSIIPLDLMWAQLKRIAKENTAIVLMAGQPFTSNLIMSNIEMFKYCWYWQKERLTNIAQVKKRAGKTVEECCVFYQKQPTYNPIMVKYEGPKRTNKVKDGKLGELADSGMKKVKEYEDNGWRYPTQVLNIQRDILTCNLHKTQKPVALMEYMIKTYTDEGQLVLDFAAGSGTTGVAAKNLNRDYILIEKEPKFVDIARNRLNEK